jgi:hypothetical protein
LGCLGGLSPSAASAGPWVPEPGEGYAKLWVKWLYGFGLRDGDGTYYELGTYNELFVSTYGEVGLVRNLAMYWHTDLLRTFYLEDLTTGSPDVHAGPGDPALGFRYELVSAGRFVKPSREPHSRAATPCSQSSAGRKAIRRSVSSGSALGPGTSAAACRWATDGIASTPRRLGP